MRILCVNPSLLSGWGSHVPHSGNEAAFMNHGFAMISAVLKKAGHETFMVDLRALSGWQQFEQVICSSQYDFAMMSFMSCDEATAREAARIMKAVAPNKIIVAGGIHLSVTQTREYPNVDTIVLGEGESHILDIVAEIEAGRRPLPHYDLQPIADLDTLPFVDRELYNAQVEQTSPLLPLLPEPFVTIVAGRGCWGKCTFCAPSRNLISGDGIRVRSPEHFLDEVCLLNERLGGIGSLMIHDDLLGQKAWIARFIEEWRRRLPRIPFWCQMRVDTVLRIREFIPDLAEIGLTWVSLGLESGSQRMLDFLQKGTTVEQNIEAASVLHESHVNIFGNYIIGLPTETKEDLDATERMLSVIRPEWHSTSTYTSYPGSYLYEWIKDNDYWVPGDSHYSRIRYPFERMIKGIDYNDLRRRGGEWTARHKGELRQWVPRPAPISQPYVRPKNADGSVKKPKISIITISYNRPEFLQEAIDSMMAQTMPDWELVIVENSGPGNLPVRAVCEKAAKDERVRIIYHDQNIDNCAICWNEGLSLATGECWGILDDDDRKRPTYCEKMVGHLDANPASDAVVCGVRFIGDQTGQRMGRAQDIPNLRKQNFIGSGEIVYRRSVIDAIGYFDENMVSQEDWDYVLRFFTRMGRERAGFLGELLADYRWHPVKRMARSHELKMLECARAIQTKRQPEKVRMTLRTPVDPRVTASQKQVAEGVRAGLATLPFVEMVDADTDTDLVLLVGPIWHFGAEKLSQMKAQYHGKPLMGLLLEDPQGITGNLPMMPYLDWIVTNDANAFDLYQSIFHTPRQVYQWNCLSVSEDVLRMREVAEAKEHDVCFVGYPYPSRIEFIRSLRSRLKSDVRMVVVGDTWDKQGIVNIETYPTLDDTATARIGMKSRIVICKHRTQLDPGGFPIVQPGSVNRGYTECAYNALVMIDSDRPDSSFTDEVVRYTDAMDAVGKIEHYLGHPDELSVMAAKAMGRAKDFSYAARLGMILNSFRSPRYNVRIM